jgi:hypothetical protein
MSGHFNNLYGHPPTIKSRTVEGFRKLIKTVDLGTNNLVIDIGPIFNLWGPFQYMRRNLVLMTFLWVLRATPLSFVTMGLEKHFTIKIMHFSSIILHILLKRY